MTVMSEENNEPTIWIANSLQAWAKGVTEEQAFREYLLQRDVGDVDNVYLYEVVAGGDFEILCGSVRGEDVLDEVKYVMSEDSDELINDDYGYIVSEEEYYAEVDSVEKVVR